MKKLSLFTVILIFCYVSVSSQSCLPEGIEFNTQAQIDSFQFNHPNCIDIEGDVEISGVDIANLNDLNVLTSIGGGLNIIHNDNLISLMGLRNLSSIGGSLGIGGNDAIISLIGLESLTSIGAVLHIAGCNALTSLSGLNNLTSIGESLWVGNNASLTSLTGLDNIIAETIDGLYLYDNISLSNCEIQSICDYLSSQNAIVTIHDNATGCNNQAEVEDSCPGFYIKEVNTNDYFEFYPNPARFEVNISTHNQKDIEELCIYNPTGQQVLQERPAYGTIDISDLKPGMYIVEVTVENGKIRQKLLVQR